MKKFWNWKTIRNEEEGPVERVLEFYGTIAEESWFDDDITPAMFKNELFSGEGPVTIWISSPGGDCFAASQIYAMLMDYKGPITVKIDGIAASAASVIAMAGTDVLMAPTAMMMIHNPATIAMGDHKDMEKAIDMLGEVKDAIINAYEIKTSQPRKTLSKMMDEETWMNARKAVELGFADGLIEDSKTSPAEDAYAFSAHAAETVLMNKLAEKTKPIEDVKTGRSVDDLRASLYKKLL
ncbi:head maturation protease, ClpP-related [Eubacterium sp. AB3007]|uniref:head maturation protease, ClpP-related n=1 Tax=Eubacterium sp. AB3007 TaxID=1392487 RepID=UPI000691F4A3|nr:head maturation protease, ClpP-related [Eubacterium sp. AB3007]